MPAPEQFETVGNRGVFRLGGSMPLQQAVRRISEAIAYAREQGLSDILVDALAVGGFDPPTTSERYFMVDEWAHAAGGSVRLALVVRPEMIDPNRFGVTVARNRGLAGEVFASEDDAVAWLDGQR